MIDYETKFQQCTHALNRYTVLNYIITDTLKQFHSNLKHVGIAQANKVHRLSM